MCWSTIWWFGAHEITIQIKTQTVCTPVPSSHPHPSPGSLLLQSVTMDWRIDMACSWRLHVDCRRQCYFVFGSLYPLPQSLRREHSASSQSEHGSNVRNDLLLLFNYCSQCHPVKGAVGKEAGLDQHQKIELTLLSGCRIVRFALCGHLQDIEYLWYISEWLAILNL